MGDGLRVAEKVLKAHGLSVEQSGRAVEIGGAGHSWTGLGLDKVGALRIIGETAARQVVWA